MKKKALFGHLASIPKDGNPIIDSGKNVSEEEFTNIAKEIRQLIKNWNSGDIPPANLPADPSPRGDPPELSQPSNESPSQHLPDWRIRPKPRIIAMALSVAILVVVSTGSATFWFVLHHTDQNGNSLSFQKANTPTSGTLTTTHPPSSTPTMALGALQILSRFCRDLREGSYSDAYGLLNAHLLTIYSTVDQFKQPWVDLNIKGYDLKSKDCIAADFHQANSDTYQGTITLPRNDNSNPARELVTIDDKDVTGIWKVSDWQSATR